MAAGRGIGAVLRVLSRLGRGFCSVCGSPVVNKPSYPEYGVPLGILDDDPGMRPELHCFAASKAPWFEISDDLPQHPEYPPRA
jgi:hypothetical protein